MAEDNKAAEKQAEANTKKAEAEGQISTHEAALEAGYFGVKPDRGDIPDNINEYSQEKARKALYDKGKMP